MPTTLQAIRITPQDLSNQASENRFPYTLSFNDGTAAVSIIGGGTGSVALSDVLPFYGSKDVLLTNSDPANDILWQVGGTLQVFETGYTGVHKFQFSVKNKAANGVPATGRVFILINSNPTYYIDFDTEEVYDNWITFWQSIPMEAGDLLTMQFRYDGNESESASTQLGWGGFKIEYGDRLIAVPTTYTEPNNILRQLETLNFPSTLAGAQSEISVVFDGSVVSEFVSVGVPVANITAGGVYDAYVSASGTVKARFINNTMSTIDPPSGTFSLTIIK